MIKLDDSPGKNDSQNIRPGGRNYDSRTFLGILFVVIGSILIARNYGWLDYDLSRHLISWQMLLIVIGLFNLARRAYTPAVILIGIGLFFLIDFPDNFRENFWPALIILVGISFIFFNGGVLLTATITIITIISLTILAMSIPVQLIILMKPQFLAEKQYPLSVKILREGKSPQFLADQKLTCFTRNLHPDAHWMWQISSGELKSLFLRIGISKLRWSQFLAGSKTSEAVR